MGKADECADHNPIAGSRARPEARGSLHISRARCVRGAGMGLGGSLRKRVRWKGAASSPVHCVLHCSMALAGACSLASTKFLPLLLPNGVRLQ